MADDIDPDPQLAATHQAASEFATQLVGLTQSAAAEQADTDGRFHVQFIAEGAIVTLDFRADRIRATVVDDRVVAATAG